MKIEDYVSGKYTQQFEYKSFSPSLINHEWTWNDARINTLLERASSSLASLNSFSRIVPDVDLFIYMHVLKEANTSSRIEGTRTEMDEVLKDKEFIADEKKDDWQEVQNYIQAMNMAIDELKNIPLSTRLLRKTHEILMHGVRGERKTPGEYRRSQNWIGGTSLKDAFFIPPHHEEMPSLLTDLEKFWHNETIDVPHLIRVSISHFQFETIHPFLDGNGRIGRLLITLYLLSHGLLDKPCLYLSAFMEKHKGEYYDSLTVVRSSNDMGQWIRFFLNAVTETSNKGIETFQRILELRDECRQKVMTLGARTKKGYKLLKAFYARPVMNVSEVADLLEVTGPTANRFIADFQRLGILSEVTGYRRNRQFFFKKYYTLFLE